MCVCACASALVGSTSQGMVVCVLPCCCFRRVRQPPHVAEMAPAKGLEAGQPPPPNIVGVRSCDGAFFVKRRGERHGALSRPLVRGPWPEPLGGGDADIHHHVSCDDLDACMQLRFLALLRALSFSEWGRSHGRIISLSPVVLFGLRFAVVAFLACCS